MEPLASETSLPFPYFFILFCNCPDNSSCGSAPGFSCWRCYPRVGGWQPASSSSCLDLQRWEPASSCKSNQKQQEQPHTEGSLNNSLDFNTGPNLVNDHPDAILLSLEIDEAATKSNKL